MMLSLSVVIIELVALSHLKVGVSVDQSALLVLATCFPAVIGPNTPKKPPYADGVLHEHHSTGCDACANPVIYPLHSFFFRSALVETWLSDPSHLSNPTIATYGAL